MNDRIYLSKAEVGQLEEEYVLRALRSGWVAPLGPEVDAFEREIAERVGVAHALALSSGTAALHLALLGLGAGPGTVVVVPTMTFAATAMPVLYVGAEPVFVDAQEDGNVDAGLMLETIDKLRAEGKHVAAAISVDLFGRPADYDVLVPGLEERGVPLLEDAAEALGASYRDKAAGSFGAAGVLSFNGNKIMTTSGGGMLLSDDEEFILRARHLSTQAREPVPYYEHADVGYNYRLSNILAALGRAQLAQLDRMIARRREIRAMYSDAFAGMRGLTPMAAEDPDHSENCWLSTFLLAESLGNVDSLIAELAAQGIEARHLWKPMHLQPVFASRRRTGGHVSERLFRNGVALPSGAGLTDKEVATVVDRVRRWIAR